MIRHLRFCCLLKWDVMAILDHQESHEMPPFPISGSRRQNVGSELLLIVRGIMRLISIHNDTFCFLKEAALNWGFGGRWLGWGPINYFPLS